MADRCVYRSGWPEESSSRCFLWRCLTGNICLAYAAPSLRVSSAIRQLMNLQAVQKGPLFGCAPVGCLASFSATDTSPKAHRRPHGQCQRLGTLIIALFSGCPLFLPAAESIATYS